MKFCAHSRADGSILVEQTEGEPMGVLGRLALATKVELFVNSGYIDPSHVARLAVIREIREWAEDNQDTVATFEHDERGLCYVGAKDLLAKLDSMEGEE
jgi:hypothetical protein